MRPRRASKHRADGAALVVKATNQNLHLKVAPARRFVEFVVREGCPGIPAQVEPRSVQHPRLDERAIAGADVVTFVNVIVAREHTRVAVHIHRRHRAKRKANGSDLHERLLG